MEYLIIAVVSVWAVEVFLRLPVRDAVNELWRVSQKALRTVASPRISDHWKEKVLLVYARLSFAGTVKLAAYIAVFIALTLLPVVAVDYFRLTEQPVLSLFGTTRGVIFSTLIALCYFRVRARFAE